MNRSTRPFAALTVAGALLASLALPSGRVAPAAYAAQGAAMRSSNIVYEHGCPPPLDPSVQSVTQTIHVGETVTLSLEGLPYEPWTLDPDDSDVRSLAVMTLERVGEDSLDRWDYDPKIDRYRTMSEPISCWTFRGAHVGRIRLAFREPEWWISPVILDVTVGE